MDLKRYNTFSYAISIFGIVLGACTISIHGRYVLSKPTEENGGKWRQKNA